MNLLTFLVGCILAVLLIGPANVMILALVIVLGAALWWFCANLAEGTGQIVEAACKWWFRRW